MMRLLLTLVLVWALALTTQAQMQKGSWMLDGQAGIVRNKIAENEVATSGGWQDHTHRGANFYLQPGLGYFVKDNWAVGLSGDFQFVKGSTQYDGNELTKGDYRIYGLGLFTRKYLPFGEKLSMYGDLRVAGFLGNSGFIDIDTLERTIGAKTKGISASAGLGVQYLVTKYIGLHLQSPLLNYRFKKDFAKNNVETYRWNDLNAGLFYSFQVGGTFFF